VIVHYVDIGESIDHHCLNFLFINNVVVLAFLNAVNGQNFKVSYKLVYKT
jgi:hypothetical protein